MTDLGRAMRSAAENAAAETVAPPFARIERRHRARRTRQVALAGVAVVAAGGIAVAAPGLGRGATPLPPAASPSGTALKPYRDLPNDPAAVEAVRACIVRQGLPVPARGLPYLNAPYQLMFEPGYSEGYDICLSENGYEEFALKLTPELREQDRSDDACARATDDEADPYERGQGVTGEWQMRAGFDGNLICLRLSYDGRDLPSRGNEERKTPIEREDRFLRHRTAGEVLLYGWRDVTVSKVEIVFEDGRRYEEFLSGPVDGPARFYAVALPVPRGESLRYTVREYDNEYQLVRGGDNRILAGPSD
jgi:hypothetical protein